MRLINQPCFSIGTKFPYSDWPEIVHHFLDRQGLTCHRFVYFFDELIFNETGDDKTLQSRCAKAVKDCPALGDIHFLNGRAYGTSDSLWLSNINSDTGCAEAEKAGKTIWFFLSIQERRHICAGKKERRQTCSAV